MENVNIQRPTYYNTSRFVIKPKHQTTCHNHHDTEVLIVISGEGQMHINGREHELKPGSIVNLTPLETHVINNTSKNDDLVICNFWWNDDGYFKALMNAKLASINQSIQAKEINLILPSFTTPNGNLHLGHIAGPLLAADILKRICINSNAIAFLLSGTIGHQTQVQVAADKIGKTYQETALYYSENIKNSLDKIGIKTDCFVTLESKEHLINISNLFIKRLFEKNLLYFKEDEVNYCFDCKKYLFEANVFGNCPHCSHEVNAECESCFEYFHENELQNPICLTCKKTPTLKKLGRYYFSLDPFRHVVENLYHRQAYTGLAKSFVEKILKKSLPDIQMTILAKQGVPFISDHLSNQVLYSAVELVPRFLVAAKIMLHAHANTENWEEYLSSNKVNLHLLFGVDNLYLRSIIFPILLHAFNEQLVDNINFSVNEFYRLNDEKFSTSRKHVISVEEMKDTVDLEYLRYYLAMTRPEVYATSFYKDRLDTWIEEGSLKKYIKLVEQFEIKLASKFNCSVPESGTWDNFHYAYQHFLNSNIPLILSSTRLDSFNLKNYMTLLNMIIELTVDFFEEGIKSNMTQTCSKTFYALSAKGILSISILLSPICPDISKRIQTIFHKKNAPSVLGHEYLNQWV